MASVVEAIKPPELARNFLAQEDVIALMEKHAFGICSEDSKYVPEPPYPMEICLKPYPQGYETPTFVLFDGRKGNPKEHICGFLDTLVRNFKDRDLRLHEFSKSLTNRS
ncbi:hypothetical protein TIFTF001_035045 [Ficus carica]|uniref:Uncharacterized protein n=1 Tax=Ficus carica TaxID=3494 RepID=A0AA88E190_FICCA|nr:hypothetical protein TIFTF001_035045 [Ficus carica]